MDRSSVGLEISFRHVREVALSESSYAPKKCWPRSKYALTCRDALQSDALEKDEFDIAIVGGGLVGAAIAWGAASGRRVALLDEGDIALRAARGNFALVWVQGKGLGMPQYGM